HEVNVHLMRDGSTYGVDQFGRIPDGTPNVAGWPPVPSTGLPSGQVAVLFLSHDPTSVSQLFTSMACPVPPAISQPPGTAIYSSTVESTGATGRGKAWHITTDLPVSAYDILPFGGAKSYLPSAELVLPTTAWGNNYVAVLPREGAPPWGQIVAAADNTM